jgi:putative SOS response-associated peptidase YedK
MCNLYSMSKGQAAIRELVSIWRDHTGNLPPLPAIYPNTMAPVVYQEDGGRVLCLMRWGMPSPVFALKGKSYDRGVTNVRNTKSPHWRRWLGTSNRCLVPFTSFAEPGLDKKPVWFALGEDRPLAFFAGIYVRSWSSARKVKDGKTSDDLFAFLSTEPNAEVGAIHPKAMPVIPTSRQEIDVWLSAEPSEALALQRPLPDGSLATVME